MQNKMNPKFQVQRLIAFVILATLALQSCMSAPPEDDDVLPASSTPGEIPTWTPRPSDPTALPTTTKPAPVTSTATVTLTLENITPRVPTPKTVSVAIVGGNLFVHRGPSLYHNYIGVLYDGETVLATGRDRISRWVRIEFPDQSGKEGWITTETQYTQISGDLVNLPFIETEPAEPAFIRNCTKTIMWVYPDEVQLLDKFNEPYNEEQFIVGRHRVVDPGDPDVALEEIDLSEGERVDILYDGAGNRSKCE
jgi:hypothetical protein